MRVDQFNGDRHMHEMVDAKLAPVIAGGIEPGAFFASDPVVPTRCVHLAMLGFCHPTDEPGPTIHIALICDRIGRAVHRSLRVPGNRNGRCFDDGICGQFLCLTSFADQLRVQPLEYASARHVCFGAAACVVSTTRRGAKRNGSFHGRTLEFSMANVPLRLQMEARLWRGRVVLARHGKYCTYHSGYIDRCFVDFALVLAQQQKCFHTPSGP